MAELQELQQYVTNRLSSINPELKCQIDVEYFYKTCEPFYRAFPNITGIPANMYDECDDLIGSPCGDGDNEIEAITNLKSLLEKYLETLEDAFNHVEDPE